jgi:hypothetical protein
MAHLVHGTGVKFEYNGTEIPGLREIPEFSKPAKEKVEITCLTDTEKKYLAGIGDSVSELTFKFLYDADIFNTLNNIVEDQDCVLTLSDGSKFEFTGGFSMTYHGGGVNTAAEMSLVVTISGEPPKFTPAA